MVRRSLRFDELSIGLGNHFLVKCFPILINNVSVILKLRNVLKSPLKRPLDPLQFFVAHSPTERGNLEIDHLFVCMCVLTTLLLDDTIHTGFSLVNFNEALKMILLV